MPAPGTDLIEEKHRSSLNVIPLFLCGITSNFSLWAFPAAATAKLLQSCLTLCDPIDGSPPGSPVPGILQARTLECVAFSFSTRVLGWLRW